MLNLSKVVLQKKIKQSYLGKEKLVRMILKKIFQKRRSKNKKKKMNLQENLRMI